jgi:hypothetical protein
MPKNKNEAPPQAQASQTAPDPWEEGMGSVPAELLAGYTETDTAAGSAFPPYWSPIEGKRFMASVVDIDTRNPEFVRYTFVAAHPIMCYRGEVDSQEEVRVLPGEHFSVSAYFTLPLDEYMGLGNVLIEVKDKMKLRNGNTMWRWGVTLTPTQKVQLTGIRAEKHRLALEHQKRTKELENKAFGDKPAQQPTTPAAA